MRLHTITASALAAVAFLASGVAAQDGQVTSVSTYTSYITVERVVETTYATLSSSTAAAVDTDLPNEASFLTPPVASATMAPLPSSNGTSPALSTGVVPSATVSTFPQQTDNAAARMGSQAYTFAAVAGVIGLAVL